MKVSLETLEALEITLSGRRTLGLDIGSKVGAEIQGHRYPNREFILHSMGKRKN